MFINLILLSIVAIIYLLLGVLAFINKPKDKYVRIFFIFIVLMAVWIIANFFSDLAKEYSLVMFWMKLTFIMPVIFVTILFYFSLIFPKGKINNWLKYSIWVASLVITVLIFSRLIIWDVTITKSGADVTFGSLGALYLLYFLGFLSAAIYVLLKKYLKEKGVEKKQLGFLLLGLCLFLIGATITNLIIPFAWGIFEPSKYGPYFSIIFTTMTFYAITRHHLFDIKIIATEIFAVVISAIMFVQIFAYESSQGVFLGVLLFIGVAFFSYLLFRSVNKEVQAKNKIVSLNKELNQKNTYLDELLKQKSEFLHITSHQLKTPISIIRGYLSMILDGDYTGTKKDDAIAKAMMASNRLGDTVRDFLDASDLEGENIYFKLSPVSITKIIEDLIDNKQVLLKNKDLKLELIKPQTPLPLALTSEERITDVFSNLIDNAIFYTPQGSVKVLLSADSKSIQIEVRDTGIGILPEEGEKLFQKFFRSVRSSLLKPDGSGLGLFIAQKIVLNCGGKIWLKSQGLGKGTSFFVKLPIHNKK